MIHSDFEKIAIFEFNKEVSHSITKGYLSDDFLNSDRYLKSQRYLLFLILVLKPLSYQEIKELALMVFKAFVFIKGKNEPLDNEIENIWDKYRETFLTKFKAMVWEIIKSGYIEYELHNNKLDMGDGWTVSINPKAFIEMYQDFDPVGFPKCYKEYISAMKRMAKNLRDSTEQFEMENIQNPVAPKKINSEYTVKSVIIAYFYMYKKGIYPIPEITEKGKKLLFYKKLADTYKLSYNSFRTDWNPLEDKNNRLIQSENIKLAIKLLGTFNYPKIKEAIELANSELNEAGLKS